MKTFKDFLAETLNEAHKSEHTGYIIKRIQNKARSFGVDLVDFVVVEDKDDGETYDVEILIGNVKSGGCHVSLKIHSHVSMKRQELRTHKDKNVLNVFIGIEPVVRAMGNEIAEYGIDMSDELITKITKEILRTLGIRVK